MASATYEETAELLYSSMSRGKRLERMVRSRPRLLAVMRRWLEILGLSEAVGRLPVVHIAGTKGKGSTSAFCESILRHHGLRTGLFTSPHLVSLRERFRLDGRPLAEDKFIDHAQRVWAQLVEHAAPEEDDVTSPSGTNDLEHPPFPGFFHCLTLLAFSVFVAEAVDVVILEVGMGGRLDATNVVPHPLVCGVTTLDYDHTQILGPTLWHIAGEKAGIFKQHVPAWTVPQTEEALDRLREVAAAVEAPLSVATPRFLLDAGVRPWDGVPTATRHDDKEEGEGEEEGEEQEVLLGLAGTFQLTNAALAVRLCQAVLHSLAKGKEEGGGRGEGEYAVNELSAPIRAGLRRTRWPGRAQVLRRGRFTFFLDGAHTARSMRACADWFREASSVLSARSAAAARQLLWFNCGHEKEAVPLLLPLARAAIPWGGVFMCPFDFARPSRVRPPSLEDAIRHCLESPRRLLGAVRIDPEAEGDGPDVGAGGGREREEEEEEEEGGALAWQRTLADVWRACFTDPRLRRLHLTGADGEETLWDPALEARLADSEPEGAEIARDAPPVRVLPSVEAVWGALRAEEGGEGGEVHVLVTGSLYLVGDVLRALDWREDEQG